jgi:hypothetical protein
MSTDFVVSAIGERAAEWREVFGTDSLPVKSMIPAWASAPGIARAQFYQLDLDALTVEQLGRLVQHTAAKFALPVQQVRDGLVEHGMPLLADGLAITVYHPQRWLPDEEEFSAGEPDDEEAAAWYDEVEPWKDDAE